MVLVRSVWLEWNIFFDYGVRAFFGCSFMCYSFVLHFISYCWGVTSCGAVHSGVVSFARCFEVSAILIDDFSLLGGVYLTIMN